MKSFVTFFFIFNLIFSINVFAETPSIKTKLGQQAESTVSSLVFKCEGYPSETPGHIDIEKPKDEKYYKNIYPKWNCPHQKSVEKLFNELYIPAKPPTGTKNNLQTRMEENPQIKISITASKILNKNCNCNLYYENKYQNKPLKKPLMTCKYSGTYQDPPQIQ